MNGRSGIEMQVKTDRKDLHLSLREMDHGSSVIFELPGFTKAGSGKEGGEGNLMVGIECAALAGGPGIEC